MIIHLNSCYILKNMSEVKNFNAEISKVLDIMINSLYTNKDVFLRELISNASDACEKLRYSSISDQSLLENDIELKIIIEIDRENKMLIVKDNGIGMNKEELIENLGTIAKSGTEDFIKHLSNSKLNDKTQDMIGQFGVGFYSSFMVADKVSVKSKKAGSNEAFSWVSDGKNSYEISELTEDFTRGTEISLHLKEEFKDDYLDKFKIKNIIESYSNHISTPILLKHEDKLDELKINKKAALWSIPKKEITENEYEEFFKSISHIPGKPWAIIHNQIEGNVNYTNLLFIPSSKPFDLFHPDRQTRVKLYVKKIFITEQNASLIPKYLRFLYGVIDSPDLPLNINRETLQDNIMIGKIRDLIVKKVLLELKNKQEKDFESYAEFWGNFGQVLKEGLCEPTSDRDSLLDLILFKTTKSHGKYISMKTYVDRIKDNKYDIYYYISETDDADSNPQIEGFLKKDIEVILLEDHVDNFWTTVIHDYKGKNIKSINRADIDLSEDSKKTDEEKQKNENENIEIINLFEKSLIGVVKNVVISKKLTDSSACLSIPEGSMDIKMEKFLIAQGQIKSSSLKTLEINPENNLVKKTFLALKNKEENGADMALTIFEIACLAQDEVLQHPNKFAKRLFKLLGDGC